MNNYGSYSVETGEFPSAHDSEEVPLRSNREDSNPGSIFEGSSKETRPRVRIPLLVGIVLWIMVMLFELSPILFFVSESDTMSLESNSTDTGLMDDDDFEHFLPNSSVYLGVYNTRPCSFEECISSPCRDAKSTPFDCLALKHNKSIRGGCGRSPWRSDTCFDQCNAIGCDVLLQYESEKKKTTSRDTDCDVECPKFWCSQDRLCGDGSIPYQCIAGRSKFGCSVDKYEWTLRSTESECSSCCKTTSCDNET